MARIYISSTYSDLQEERRAASDAVLRAGHQPVGMENYTADDRPPLEKCLADVRSCQAYIGIFALRYGHRPRGHDASITELEYREAGLHRIPRLVFLLREGASWPTDRVDRDRTRIDRLRQELSTEHTIDWFSHADELGADVTAAVHARLGRGRPLPELLAFTPDRSDQQLALTEALLAHRERPHRPLICVFAGDEFQSQDTFLRRLEELVLPELLGLAPEQKLLSRQLTLPRDFRGEDDLHRKLEITLAQNVTRSQVPLEEVARYMDDHPAPVTLQTHLLTEDWRRHGTSILRHYLSFWRQRWPGLSRQRLLIFVSVKYQVPPDGLLEWGRRRLIAAANKEMEAELEALGLGVEEKLHGVLLPRLGCISRGEAENWARSEYTQRYCHGEDLMREIRRIFAQEVAQAADACLPMERLAERLKGILYHFNNAT